MNRKQIAIKMPIGEFKREHKRLLNVLKTGKGRLKEFKDQKQELEKYDKKS